MTKRKSVLNLKPLSHRSRAIVKARAAPLRPQAKTRHREPDLFAVAQVTQDDVRLWLATVPRIDPDSPRAARYVENYRVVEKIARAKATGLWPPEGHS